MRINFDEIPVGRDRISRDDGVAHVIDRHAESRRGARDVRQVAVVVEWGHVINQLWARPTQGLSSARGRGDDDACENDGRDQEMTKPSPAPEK